MARVNVAGWCIVFSLAAWLASLGPVIAGESSEDGQRLSARYIPLLAQVYRPVPPPDHSPGDDPDQDPPNVQPQPPRTPTPTPAPVPPTLAPPASTYSPWVFDDSDSRYLTQQDLAHLSQEQLWKARNEIFARRGYRFHTDRGIAYGHSLGGYYSPLESDGSRVYNGMNRYERENIELIKKYER